MDYAANDIDRKCFYMNAALLADGTEKGSKASKYLKEVCISFVEALPLVISPVTIADMALDKVKELVADQTA